MTLFDDVCDSQLERITASREFDKKEQEIINKNNQLKRQYEDFLVDNLLEGIPIPEHVDVGWYAVVGYEDKNFVFAGYRSTSEEAAEFCRERFGVEGGRSKGHIIEMVDTYFSSPIHPNITIKRI